MSHPTPDAIASANEGAMTPQQAAAMLDQTTHEARRKLTPSPPWLLTTRAVAVLAALGNIWLTVRGQHPYQGPTGADAPVLVAFIVLNFFATVTVRERALAGVRGATRFRPAEIAIFVAVFAAVPLIMWALDSAGVSFALYPTTVVIVPGLALASIQTARGGWGSSWGGLAVTAVGVAGAFAGPVGSWAVAAVGLCAVLLGKAAVVARQQRGSLS
jgi:hypothetical protein